jgi:hypothetical protein
MSTQLISKRNPVGASVEEVSATPFWKALSPAAKKILTLFFEDKDHDMADSVANFHGVAMTRAKAETVAEHLLNDENVQKVIDLRYFGHTQ